jgi:hypothetical protein
MKFMHEFPQDENGVVQSYADALEAVIARTQRRVDRLFHLAQERGPILFVRNPIYADPLEPEAFSREVQELMSALRQRFGSFDKFDLLLVNAPEVQPSSSLMQIAFEDEGSTWKGNVFGWTAQLRSIGRYVGDQPQPVSGAIN